MHAAKARRAVSKVCERAATRELGCPARGGQMMRAGGGGAAAEKWPCLAPHSLSPSSSSSSSPSSESELAAFSFALALNDTGKPKAAICLWIASSSSATAGPFFLAGLRGSEADACCWCAVGGAAAGTCRAAGTCGACDCAGAGASANADTTSFLGGAVAGPSSDDEDDCSASWGSAVLSILVSLAPSLHSSLLLSMPPLPPPAPCWPPFEPLPPPP